MELCECSILVLCVFGWRFLCIMFKMVRFVCWLFWFLYFVHSCEGYVVCVCFRSFCSVCGCLFVFGATCFVSYALFWV